MIKGILIDGKNQKNSASIDDVGALLVTVSQIPPLLEGIKIVPYRTYLTLNGNGVTTDMRVDGSVTNQKFYIQASAYNDIILSYILFVLADASAIFSKFGALTALTNGCLFEWISTERAVTLHEGIKSNFDLVQMCLGNPAFGSGADAFRGLNVSGASEAYFPIYPIKDILPPYGIRLAKGSLDKIQLIIRDNISVGMDRFDAVALGFILL